MKTQQKKNRESTNTMLAIDAETRPKINLVSKARRWNLKVTVDEVFNDYIARHQISDDKANPETACG